MMVPFDGVNIDDVVVTDGGRGLGLPHETPPGRGADSQLGGECLDSHDALKRLVQRLEDDAHAALAEYFEHRVMAQSAKLPWFLRRVEELQGQFVGGGGRVARRRLRDSRGLEKRLFQQTAGLIV